MTIGSDDEKKLEISCGIGQRNTHTLVSSDRSFSVGIVPQESPTVLGPHGKCVLFL